MNELSWTRTFLYCLFVILCAVCFVVIGGCNTYSLQRCEMIDGQQVCSSLEISSMRKYGDIGVKYNGEERSFELEASEVSTDSSAITTLAGAVVKLSEEKQ